MEITIQTGALTFKQQNNKYYVSLTDMRACEMEIDQTTFDICTHDVSWDVELFDELYTKLVERSSWVKITT